VFFVHDGSNSGGSISNVKLVAWSDVADEGWPNLIVDTTWDPRSVGRPDVPGDTDGDVNAVDYGNLIAQFGGPPGGDDADFNDDDIVDIEDFAIQRAAFAAPGSPEARPAPAAIPEPATVVLLASAGLVVLTGRRRRRAA